MSSKQELLPRRQDVLGLLLSKLGASLGAFILGMYVSGAALAVEPSLEEMAGQMIFVGFQGDSVSTTKPLADMIGDGRLGGVMYLRTNIKSLDEVARMNAQFNHSGAKFPPFVALDQEGGQIERLTKAVGFKEIPSAQDIAGRNNVAAAEATYKTMAQSIAALGFNVNFGPVVDLNINKKNPIIARYGRSYGPDVGDVVKYAGTFVRAHSSAKVMTALKHFPGHGSSAADSHEGFVDITKTWQPQELEPYRQLIASGNADMVMVGHLYHADYADGSADQLPSSLSKNWINGVLREQLGFDGVVITDDLEMGAIRSHFSIRDTVTAAVRAGVDILLFSNTAKYRLGLPDEVREILVSEAKNDPLFAQRIRESYQRIIALKQKH